MPQLEDRCGLPSHRTPALARGESCAGRTLVASETLEYVGRDARDIVVVIIVRKTSAPRDRAGRKNRAAARRGEVHDIAAHAGILSAARARVVESKFLGHAQIIVAMPLRARNQH